MNTPNSNSKSQRASGKEPVIPDLPPRVPRSYPWARVNQREKRLLEIPTYKEPTTGPSKKPREQSIEGETFEIQRLLKRQDIMEHQHNNLVTYTRQLQTLLLGMRNSLQYAQVKIQELNAKHEASNEAEEEEDSEESQRKIQKRSRMLATLKDLLYLPPAMRIDDTIYSFSFTHFFFIELRWGGLFPI
ncbi:hypothetical protein HanPI659440_Chr11g0408541 [Helianthus annuus]|nr:hypothetical protein HanPI659440_Chr11g0408541 [Helianthus annuus]